MQTAGVKKGAHVLDAACGTGGIGLRLHQAGYRVTALDSSQAMLAAAAEKFRKSGADIAVIEQDMRQISLHQMCDAIVCACDGVNYLLDDSDTEAFFHSAYKNLKPGGVLLFDISTEYKLREVIGSNVFCDETDDLAYIWKNSYENGFSRMELTLFIREGRFFARETENHTQRAHGVENLIQLLYNAGFVDINNYEFQTRKKPGKKIQRVQFAARRQG
jgi:cyclopropane fatty-acyl-phospholipid synthase-like methyltransferase